MTTQVWTAPAEEHMVKLLKRTVIELTPRVGQLVNCRSGEGAAENTFAFLPNLYPFDYGLLEILLCSEV